MWISSFITVEKTIPPPRTPRKYFLRTEFSEAVSTFWCLNERPAENSERRVSGIEEVEARCYRLNGEPDVSRDSHA